MIEQILLEANSVSDLETALRTFCAEHWKSTACYYLVYNEDRQTLRYREREWSLRSDVQTDKCALQLRPCQDMSLSWPEELVSKGSHRMSIPIFHWGSLNAVVALSFDTEPVDLDNLEEIVRTLGLLGEKVLHRDMSENFVGRCKEFLVRAVESHGQGGHVQRCCRLIQAIAARMDCSPQVQSELLDASQYHDIGLLTFPEPASAVAIRDHSLVGANLLRCHPDLFQVATLVEAHHERYDGSGQPKGIQGNDLPLECWILALVENFVESWESSESSYEIKVKEFFAGDAKHHHPDVVDALCGLVDSGKLPELL